MTAVVNAENSSVSAVPPFLASTTVSASAAAAVAAEGGSKRRQADAAAGAPKMDGHVYGALIAACAKSIRANSGDLRQQLVVLERAFQVGVVGGAAARKIEPAVVCRCHSMGGPALTDTPPCKRRCCSRR